MILEGKRILITGGTGSMGKVLVQKILGNEQGIPKKIIIFSRDEDKQRDMRIEFMDQIAQQDTTSYKHYKQALEFRIGDVRNYADVVMAVQDADIVINAAALKQIPSCEYFPYQGLLTNCTGAQNIVKAIKNYQLPIETVVGISSDKAVQPASVMGMTKAIQERIFNSANIFIKNTRFCCVRYGNMMASQGSVIPLFQQQIAKGGPVTITVPQMTRFFINLNTAVNTIFFAIKNAQAGETLIPAAPSTTVEHIAKALIGDQNIDIQVTGIRPGEKIHEVLISQEEIDYTIKRGEYYAVKPVLPELNGDIRNQPNLLTQEYSSADHVLNLAETIQLLKTNNLLEGHPVKQGRGGDRSNELSDNSYYQ